MNLQRRGISQHHVIIVRASLFLAIAVLTGMALSGCSGGNPVFSPTITQHHASARIDQLLRDTAAALSPRPQLEVSKLGTSVGLCTINPSDTADKRVQVVRTYWLRGITERDYKTIGEQILRLWKQKGYAINDTPGVGTDKPNIHAATKDDFLIALEWSAKGWLSIGASSPCLWPHGTPPPGH
ncbi:MAG: hypothetical protein J2P25_24010 [Nocardiopsaceae bacterium]|nr:hypothetical protein [Nocardiopsaceae bacterium]